MKCPNCGKEVAEGLRYCDKCGQEFNLVPDFDPEVETQMDKVLTRLAKKIDGEPVQGDTLEIKVSNISVQSAAREKGAQNRPQGSQKKQAQGRVRTDKREPSERAAGTRTLSGAARKTKQKSRATHTRKSRKTNKKILYSVIGAVALVVILIVIISSLHKTAEDYIRMSEKAYAAGDLTEAFDCLDKAEQEATREAEVYLLRARYLRENGDVQGAVSQLQNVTNSAAFSEEDLLTAYTQLAEIYAKEGDYEALTQLMSRCPFEALKVNYQSKLPAAPSISPGGGSFETKVEVSITAEEGTSAIFYTLDGSAPGPESLPYTGPFVIENVGEVVVQAVAADANGLCGFVGTASFEIKKPQVKAPHVLQESGNYSKNTKIVVVADEGLTIHYTTAEKGTPDEESPVYKEPIDMPAGESFFNFVCIDEEGNVSETVTRQYILEIERRISEHQAITYVMGELQKKGYLQDTLSFQVDGTVTIGNEGEFYFIREFNNGELTGLIYGVSTQTGLTSRLGYDSEGKLFLMGF